MNDIARIALIGVTGFGQKHQEAIALLQNRHLARLVATTIINPAEVSALCQKLESSGTRIYSDYQEMLTQEAGNIDLCVIPTGISWHCPMTLAALQAGCHVFVEKPAAGTVEEVDQMIKAEKQSPYRIFVGFHDLFQGTTLNVKRRILDGNIGDIQRIRVRGSWPRPSFYYTRNNWAGKIKCGDSFVYDSPANNAFAHYLMAALYFAGKEVQTAASALSFEAELYRAQAIESFDTICTRIQTDTGIEILYSVTHSGLENQNPILEIQGSKGSVRWEVFSGFTFHPWKERLDTPTDEEMRVQMYTRIFEAIQSGQPVGCSLHMARKHTEFINRLHTNTYIQTVDPAWLDLVSTDEIKQVHIRNIETALNKSFEEFKLFSEVGLEWATSHTPSNP